MKVNPKSIWIVSREYAGIAEAGGVKNVTTSLSESLVKNAYDVTVFIPQYGCSELQNLREYSLLSAVNSVISIADELYSIAYAQAFAGPVKIILIQSPVFQEKTAVYTYTTADEKKNPIHKRGQGHADSHIMNILFQRAVLEYAVLTHSISQIIHCQDASASMIPVFAREDVRLKKLFSDTSCIVTIHNAGPGYHHAFSSIDEAYRITNLPHHVLMKGMNNHFVEPFILASKYSLLTTVSPWYADELTDPEYPFSDGLSFQFAAGKIQIKGILNAIDYERYDPEDTEKSLLPVPFSPVKGFLDGKKEILRLFLKKISQGIHGIIDHENRLSTIEQFGSLSTISQNPVIFSYHGRIVWQKGLEILAHAARMLLTDCKNACFIIIGQGQPEIEQMHIDLSVEFPGRYLYIRGYERALARECIASSDFIVLPSLFEPCGLEDFIAQIYGTLPVAHAVGGLKKIIHEETGFLYDDNSAQGLYSVLKNTAHMYAEQPDTIRAMQIKAAQKVREEFTWNTIVPEQYIPLYENLVKSKSQ